MADKSTTPAPTVLERQTALETARREIAASEADTIAAIVDELKTPEITAKIAKLRKLVDEGLGAGPARESVEGLLRTLPSTVGALEMLRDQRRREAGDAGSG